jgi:predicted Zn-dependent peptidase
MYKKHILKNGIRFLEVPYKGTKAITVLVLFKVGSRFESDPLNGASHFIEHLMFKGTKRRPTTLDISRELDGVGAEYNAFTSKDYTGYYIKITSEHLQLALDMLSDMLFHSKFDAKEMTREKKVILEEINMYRDNPIMHIEDMIEDAIFDGHTLGRPISGTKETMEAMTRASVLDFKERFYKPENIVIGIAGNVDGKISAKTQEFFGAFKGSDKETIGEFHKFEHICGVPKVVIENKKTEQVQLALGFPSYPLGDKRLPALTMLSTILGGTMSSRLFTEVREKRGLAYSVRSQIETYEDTGAFVVRAGLDPARIELALKTILNELKKIKKNGVTSAELSRAKETAKGHMALALEDSEALAAWYAKQELMKQELKTPDEKLEKIYRVKKEDVKKVAEEIIDWKKISLVIIGPFDKKEKFEKLLKI